MNADKNTVSQLKEQNLSITDLRLSDNSDEDCNSEHHDICSKLKHKINAIEEKIAMKTIKKNQINTFELGTNELKNFKDRSKEFFAKIGSPLYISTQKAKLVKYKKMLKTIESSKEAKDDTNKPDVIKSDVNKNGANKSGLLKPIIYIASNNHKDDLLPELPDSEFVNRELGMNNFTSNNELYEESTAHSMYPEELCDQIKEETKFNPVNNLKYDTDVSNDDANKNSTIENYQQYIPKISYSHYEDKYTQTTIEDNEQNISHNKDNLNSDSHKPLRNGIFIGILIAYILSMFVDFII